MINSKGLNITALWGPRVEAPASLARRTLHLLSALQRMHPTFEQWFVAEDGRGVPFPLSQDVIEARFAFEQQEDGLSLELKTSGSGRGPSNISVDINGSSSYFNCVALYTSGRHASSNLVFCYDFWKQAMLSIAYAFDAECAFVYSNDMLPLQTPPQSAGSQFMLSWIAYAGPRLANLVSPPKMAIVEHQNDGGLLLAATKDVFDVGNEKHVSVAREIASSGAALHGRAWTAT